MSEPWILKALVSALAGFVAIGLAVQLMANSRKRMVICGRCRRYMAECECPKDTNLWVELDSLMGEWLDDDGKAELTPYGKGFEDATRSHGRVLGKLLEKYGTGND